MTCSASGRVCGLLAASLLSLTGSGCGKTAEGAMDPAPGTAGDDSASGGAFVGSGGVSGAPLANSGAGGLSTGGTDGSIIVEGGASGDGDASGDGGASGGASVVAPLPGYSLRYVPTLPAPSDVLAGVKPGDATRLSTIVRAASADGEAFIGVSHAEVISASGTDIIYEEDTPYYFTLSGGMQVIQVPQTPLGFCLSDDGSTALLAPEQVGGPALYRWTPKLGAEPIPLPAGYQQTQLADCDGAADRAVLTELSRPLVWQLGAAAITDVLPLNGTGDMELSHSGAFGRLNMSQPAPDQGADLSSTYQWSAAGPAQSLGTPAGQRCTTDLISSDGLTIAGNCFNSATQGVRAFRWTQAGLQLLEPDTTVTGLSADGSTLFGYPPTAAAERADFCIWHGSGSVTTAAWPEAGVPLDKSWTVVGTGADGSTAYMTLGPIQGLAHSARWTAATGIVLLPSDPAGGVSVPTWFIANSADGSLAVGFAGKLGAGPGLLWDAQGARDISAELLAAHVDLGAGAGELVPERVWRRATTVRIQGHTSGGLLSNSRAFIVELPLR